jgi:hypothetical protein
MPVGRQEITNTHRWINWEAVFSTRSMPQLRAAKIKLLDVVFSMRSVPQGINRASVLVTYETVAGQ